LAENSYFVTCARGLEEALAAELIDIGAANPLKEMGGVAVTGNIELGYRINLWSRVGTRVLLRVHRGEYRNEKDIYEQTLSLAWPRWFDVKRSIAVSVNARRAPLKSLDFITLRIKDAVCDRFRQALGQRPNVDVRMPDVRIMGFFDAQRFSLYLDTSGEALHARGYRIGGEANAPLKETLAAGIVRISGWQPHETLFDPMCGGGTLLIEAAQQALCIAPGAQRGFGFERLADFDQALWRSLRTAAREGARAGTELAIFGADRNNTALRGAKRNLEAAGLAHKVELQCADALTLAAPSAAGVMLVNPPYGVRQSDRAEMTQFYPRLGDWLKRNFAGWRAHIFTADLELAKLIGLRASRRVPLFNGPLECRLFAYEIVAGSNRPVRDA
jgi:putative N6-adenine-specific DNA methylase